MNDARNRLIVALDVPDAVSALAWVDRLSGRVGMFKLGLEIFVRTGPALVEAIRRRGQEVFLDLKLHDIPNTVAGAVRSAAAMDVRMLTLHASGGRAMMAAAVEAAAALRAPPSLLAVTALTSLSSGDLDMLAVRGSIESWVLRLAGLAQAAGIRAIVSSSLELPALVPALGGSFTFVVPGIRPSGAALDDQARAATPRTAIGSGADFLVVGRPILKAPSPETAVESIVREIAEALRVRTNQKL